MSEHLPILIILIFIAVYSMLARWIAKTIFTGPMVFIGCGYLLSFMFPSSPQISQEISGVLYFLAEITLVILLFLDASRTDVSHLKRHNTIPIRMLLFGMPLAMGLGFVVCLLLLPSYSWIFLLLIAAILVPTDAALAQTIIDDNNVPIRLRESVTVESGLNDGIGFPIILYIASLSAVVSLHSQGASHWLSFAATQLLLGPLVGCVIGYFGAKMFSFAQDKKLTSDVFMGIGVLALAGISYLVATLVDGNGFIAAFFAGLVLGNIVKDKCASLCEFMESEGLIFVWLSFLLIGVGLVPMAIENMTWPIVLMLVVSLFLVRPVAIYLSLLGSRTSPTERLFLGWFGPRGLATVLFAIIVSKQLPEPQAAVLVTVSTLAVLMSTVIHGLSAKPIAARFKR